MKVDYVGRKMMNFTTKDGTHIEGLRLYVTYAAEPGTADEGIVCEQMFCNVNRPEELKKLKECKLPAVLEVEYNRFGKAAPDPDHHAEYFRLLFDSYIDLLKVRNEGFRFGLFPRSDIFNFYLVYLKNNGNIFSPRRVVLIGFHYFTTSK